MCVSTAKDPADLLAGSVGVLARLAMDGASVQCTLAGGCSTLADDFAVRVFLLEPVVKCELLAWLDVCAGKEAQVQLTPQLQGLGVQAGRTAVVGEAAVVAAAGVVDHRVIRGVEHVAVTSLQRDSCGSGQQQQQCSALL